MMNSVRDWIATALVSAVMPVVCAAAEQPAPLLEVESYRAVAGHPFEIRLNLPDGQEWATARVGELVVRAMRINEEGHREMQRRLDTNVNVGATAITHTFAHRGNALIYASVGPADGDGDEYCIKAVVSVDEAAGQAPEKVHGASYDPGITAKVGQRIEILPYLLPTALTDGSDLPVRVYFDNSARKEVDVTAYRPDGSRIVERSNSKGIAVFRIDSTGRWIIRYTHSHQGKDYVAELSFEVPTPDDEEGEAQ